MNGNVHHLSDRITQVENSDSSDDDERMTNVTREEVNARLEASEARVAASVESMRADSSGLRADMRTEMTELRADLRSEMTDLRASMREGFSLVRVDIEKVRADSHKASLDITRWIMATVVTIGLGFVGLILTGAGLYLRYLSI